MIREVPRPSLKFGDNREDRKSAGTHHERRPHRAVGTPLPTFGDVSKCAGQNRENSFAAVAQTRHEAHHRRPASYVMLAPGTIGQ